MPMPGAMSLSTRVTAKFEVKVGSTRGTKCLYVLITKVLRVQWAKLTEDLYAFV